MTGELPLEMEILYRISQALAHYHDVDAMLQEVLDILENDLDFQRGTITLKQPGEDMVRIVACKGLTAKEIQRGKYDYGEGITGQVAATMQPRIIPRISDEPAFLGRTGKRDENRAFLCVPIISKNRLIGTLSIDRPTEELPVLERAIGFLMIIANILGEAVNSMREFMEERESLLAENRQLRQELSDQYRPTNIIGNCAAMKMVYNQIGQVADSPATVLIRGESGTGKELVARALHYGSSRKNGPFVGVNIAALPEGLIESELFGHEKGSFTGAVAERIGKFEQANGGTLFLDEIGDAPVNVQVRLLRVLQERVFERVGGSTSIQTNARVLTATSQNLESLMQTGGFRDDLYYRLNIFPIFLPSLRERRSDIVLLADHFLAKCNEKYGKKINRISTPAINMMMSYHWPGNVRELENCVEHAVLTSNDDVIHGFNLPPSLQTAKHRQHELYPSEEGGFDMLMATYEREVLVDALKRHRGNCAAAARTLKTTQRVFNYRIRKLGITPKDYRVRLR